MRQKKDTAANPLEALTGVKIRQMDFKPMENIPLKPYEADAINAVNTKIEAAQADAADAQARMQQAQADFHQAQNSLTVANIQQATIFDIVLRGADRHGKQFWYKPEENALIIDPN
jgi:hypothetical protein